MNDDSKGSVGGHILKGIGGLLVGLVLVAGLWVVLQWAAPFLVVGQGGAIVAVSTPTLTAVPTPSPSPTPIPTRQPATPTSASSPIATPPAKSFAQVGNTDGDGVYIRRTPKIADKIVAWPDGTLMEIVGEDVMAEGRRWRHVKDPNGNVGWVPAEYLIPVSP